MCQIKWNENIVYLPEFYDNRGSLFPIGFKNLPFAPQRMFYISNVPSGTIRGGHAHKKCKQIFICLNGKIILHLDTVIKHTQFRLTSLQAIYIPPMVWSTQEFYNNGIALVLSSDDYDERDYIRNYNVFKELI